MNDKKADKVCRHCGKALPLLFLHRSCDACALEMIESLRELQTQRTTRGTP